eukprot:CAMPEP_0170179612 /NCGR_PEP_ID=MMETSP0040_2-20121228/18561_1 /TAXON_ID=641309 /ORGANISM="Lotharella oceanica, Strain CCMP622" /LENGTH=58 /DNA_ID=CAMNT_0010423825 /DNA_START=220 /DNA_END=396 /DNA_ORIENTATION=-
MAVALNPFSTHLASRGATNALASFSALSIISSSTKWAPPVESESMPKLSRGTFLGSYT